MTQVCCLRCTSKPLHHLLKYAEYNYLSILFRTRQGLSSVGYYTALPPSSTCRRLQVVLFGMLNSNFVSDGGGDIEIEGAFQDVDGATLLYGLIDWSEMPVWWSNDD
jgi:hypothetical protein